MTKRKRSKWTEADWAAALRKAEERGRELSDLLASGTLEPDPRFLALLGKLDALADALADVDRDSDDLPAVGARILDGLWPDAGQVLEE